MGRLVWAFEPLEETGGETGFIDMADEALAEKLIDAGKVQCGWNPEGGELRFINEKAAAEYATRQLKAGTARAKPEPKPETAAPAEAAAEPEAPAPEAPKAPKAENGNGKKRGRPPGKTGKGK